MRAGETDKACLRKHDALEQIGWRIGHELGHIGNLDADIFVNDRGAYLLEMNPRFGGGYPFSHMAGARHPEMILAWVEGHPTSPPRDWKYDLVHAKADTMIATGTRKD